MDLGAWVDQVNNRKYKALYWSQLASPGIVPGEHLPERTLVQS